MTEIRDQNHMGVREEHGELSCRAGIPDWYSMANHTLLPWTWCCHTASSLKQIIAAGLRGAGPIRSANAFDANHSPSVSDLCVLAHAHSYRRFNAYMVPCGGLSFLCRFV